MTGRPSATTTACTKCGEPIFAGDRFCGNCGAIVTGGTLDASTTPSSSANDTPTRPEGFTTYDGWERIIERLRAATVGEFEIRRELGRGGMAIVFLAHDIALRRKVAIKLMSPGLLTNYEMVRKFRDEAVMVAQMNHPNIITIHAVRNVEDLHFFIMKFVEGRPLDQVLRDVGQLSFPVARAILYQVGSALTYAHRRGVIHRDVKPSNILIDIEGDALVTDFGIAKAVDSESQTKTGSVVGTPAYMSPEQCYALPATWASDQYSLGVVAYEMIAGRAPFSGPSFAVMKAHVDEQVPPISNLRPDCPPELEAAVMRMLGKKPEDRFQSIGQALSALAARPLAEEDSQRIELGKVVRDALPTEPPLTPVSPVPIWTADPPRRPTPVAPTEPAEAPRTPTDERTTVPLPNDRPAVGKRIEPVVTPARVSAPVVPVAPVASSADVRNAVTVRTAATVPAEDPKPSRVRRSPVWIGAGALIATAAAAWIAMRPGNVVTNAADTAAVATNSVTPLPPPATPVDTPVVSPPPPVTGKTDSIVPPGPSDPPPPPAPVARSIAVVPAELTLMVGQTIRPDVTVRGQDNQVLAGQRVVWVTPNAAVATVNRLTGAVTGVGEGTTELRASTGEARATLRVRVEAPVVVATIAVDQPRRLTVGDNVTLAATIRDSRGNVMPSATPVWSSGDTTVARVASGTGIVTAVGAGTADVIASVGTKSTTVRLTVVRPVVAVDPTPTPPPPDPAAEERRTRAAIESAVGQYIAIVRGHDARRVKSLYGAESDQDRKNEQALERLMESASRLTVAEPTIRAPRVDGGTASVDFSVPMGWRNPFGRLKNEVVPFRADLQRDGADWRVTRARVVGTLSP